MAQEVSELLKKALALPAGARAALASSLLESLDDAVDASVEEEWNKRSLELALHCKCWPFLTDIGAPAIGRGGPEGNRSFFCYGLRSFSSLTLLGPNAIIRGGKSRSTGVLLSRRSCHGIFLACCDCKALAITLVCIKAWNA